MRTNIEIDDTLMAQAQALSKIKTKKEVVEKALKHYISFLKKRELLTLSGKVTWEGNLKEMRGI
jgi:Arc/MetJ family transcription regulator